MRESGGDPAEGAARDPRRRSRSAGRRPSLPSRPWGELLATGKPRLSMARRLPVGVVGVIAPFNFPLILAIRCVAPALALGNAVVLKPDPRTAVCGGVSIARVFEEAGLPAGVLHVLPGGAEAGQALVEAPETRVISFTGSTAAGRKVGEAAGKLLKRAHLELGGNTRDDRARRRRPGRRGQRRRVRLLHPPGPGLHDHRPPHRRRRDRRRVRRRGSPRRRPHLPVGDPSREQVALGPIIDEGQRDNIHRLVDGQRGTRAPRSPRAARTRGSSTAPPSSPTCGRTRRCGPNEVFGPVAPVTRFSSLDEAVELATGTEYGLSLGILTRDVMKAYALADRIPSGIVHINDQTVDDEANAPFGGVAASGTGSRFGGAAANVEAFTETQWLTMQGDIAPYPF